ncbi:MAG: hypothetical protein HYZ28_08965 [Myxococcales bacterium]|nr:hypothetical protein [Myxococcales bacterium]
MKIGALLAASTLALALAGPALAQKSKGKGKLNMDLNLPTFGALPTGEGLQKPKAEKDLPTPTTTSIDAKYEVVRLQHGRSFMRSASGATPMGGALESIALTGNPPTSERFTTVVRVKCPQRLNSSIELAVLDPRGDTAMTATGEVNFRGTKQDEVDYTVEWDPTPMRSGGDFQVLVRIGGQVMGTWPLKVVEGKK